MTETIPKMSDPGRTNDTSDAQLLAEFVCHRDEAALAMLVRRHGPMVWGVCRRVLGNHHDAEDAFQATFLVLVRRATSIGSRELLANWLYGVARRTALKLRAMSARRSRHETQVAVIPDRSTPAQDMWSDVPPLLDRELSRLPARYRSVLVFCDLEGKSRSEAARQLKVPEGTVASRLSRARAMLARRLTRRGVALSAAALAAMLTDNASAQPPASLLSGTIQAGHALASGQPASAELISPKVSLLTEGVVRTMWLTSMKVFVVLVLAVPAIGLVLKLSHRAVGPGRAGPVSSTDQNDDMAGYAYRSNWSEPADGLQIRLSLGKARWPAGEIPRFRLDLRNTNTRGNPRFYSQRQPVLCEVEVDGQWYGQRPGSGLLSGPNYPLPPGQTIPQWVNGTLDSNWEKGVTGDRRAQADAHGEPLKLSPGKHRLRIAFAPLPRDARPVTEPLEILIDPPFDKSKVDRHVGKEPAYRGRPEYCLLVFGPDAEHRIWLVLDTGAHVLYVDRHGDGNLTRDDARAQTAPRKGDAMEFDIGDLFDDRGVARYKNATLAQTPEGFDLRVQLNTSPQQVSFRQFAITSFAKDPKGAPVIRLDVDGPQ